jgi:hypothetical protein
MRWLVFACLALTLSADAPRTHVLGKQVLGKQVSGKQAECVFEQKEPGELDGHWWIRTSHCERLLYRLAYADGSFTTPPSEGAISQYYYSPQQSLDTPLRTAMTLISDRANANK